MFLIQCDSDDSVSIIANKDVLFNENTIVQQGDKVKFFWKEKEYEGTVLMYSGTLINIINYHIFCFIYTVFCATVDRLGILYSY